jgi:hypothetical protein
VTYTGVGREWMYWPTPPKPTGPTDLLFPNLAGDDWIVRPMHLRRQPTNPQIIEMETGDSAPWWRPFIDLGEPNHEAAEFSDPTLRNAHGWHDGASITMSVHAGHRYVVTAAARVVWTVAAPPGAGTDNWASVRLNLDNSHLARERYRLALLSGEYAVSMVWTATTTRDAVLKVEWGPDADGTNMHLDSSSIEAAEQR